MFGLLFAIQWDALPIKLLKIQIYPLTDIFEVRGNGVTDANQHKYDQS